MNWTISIFMLMSICSDFVQPKDFKNAFGNRVMQQRSHFATTNSAIGDIFGQQLNIQCMSRATNPMCFSANSVGVIMTTIKSIWKWILSQHLFWSVETDLFLSLKFTMCWIIINQNKISLAISKYDPIFKQSLTVSYFSGFRKDCKHIGYDGDSFSLANVVIWVMI